ncbi:MAG: hypothetical protein K6G17_06075 [Oscillospiraceae bacterium]|nr:hypothetical protein [Oscillospiraceae bacterium]
MAALAVWLAAGEAVSFVMLPRERLLTRIWLGLVFGLTALMWLPCLFAFFFGFTMRAQLLALLTAALCGAAALIRRLIRREKTERPADGPLLSKEERIGLLLSLAGTFFCCCLLHTHVLLPHEDGSLWVGQSTFGDLAMHLGFIESLFQQGRFPPEYSILPGTQLDYPFLVDAASASLRFFGLDLRLSVIVPSAVMLFGVFLGFWLLALHLCEKLLPTLAAWLLFFLNGGFGFALFLGKHPISAAFAGFYTTPTNYAAEDIRWVNVICDMLLPQRTTMAGWCVLTAALFLLLRVFERVREGEGLRETLTLAVLAGALPMIHTHSFLALGILSAVWFFASLPGMIRQGRGRRLFALYCLYGAVCLALALPQLLTWTFHSVSGGRLLHWSLGWVIGANGVLTDPFLFYTVNVGVVFLLSLPLLFVLRGRERRVFLGAAVLFVLSNVVAFQPNLYDNNKLLYVWYMLCVILVCRWFFTLTGRLKTKAASVLLASALLLTGCLSGSLSLAREAISRYRLFSPAQVRAAAFIERETEPDALFLTATNHANGPAALAGRSIVCGSGSYLYYHGLNYRERTKEVELMFRGGEDFLRLAEELGVDYVYVGEYERGSCSPNEGWFSARYPLVYDEDGVRIYRVVE